MAEFGGIRGMSARGTSSASRCCPPGLMARGSFSSAHQTGSLMLRASLLALGMFHPLLSCQLQGRPP
eukprot:4809012-Alexandrium_andersonii.AAC.1